MPAHPATGQTAIVAQHHDSTSKKNSNLRMLILYGDSSMLDVMTKPELEKARWELSDGHPDGLKAMMPAVLSSEAAKRAFAAVKLKDCIDKNLDLQPSVLNDRIQLEIRGELARMAGEHKTLAYALAHDDVILAKASEDLHGFYFGKGVHTALLNFADHTQMGTLYTAEGKPKKIQIDAALAKALSDVPLADLQGSNLYSVRDMLIQSIGENDADLRNTALGLFKADKTLLNLSGTHLTLGDIITPTAIALDPNKTKTVSALQTMKYKEYINHFTQQAAKNGVSIYDFVKDPGDPAGAVQFSLAGRTDVIGLLRRDDSVMPREVREAFKRLPLTAVLDTDGVLNPDKARDAAIEPIKTWPLLLLSQYPQMATTLIGPEAAAAILQTNTDGAEDEHRLQVVGKTQLGQFLTGDKPGSFESTSAAFVDSAYPAKARALDVIISRGQENVWPQFKQATGWTVIPYSFNIAQNKRLNKPDMDKMDHPVELDTPGRPPRKKGAAQQKAQGSHEKDIVRYALKEAQKAGINVIFTEVDTLPVIDGQPQGMLFYKAGLEKVPFGNSGTEHAAGMTFGIGQTVDGKPAPNTRVDIVLENSELNRVEQWAHEALGHGLNLCHPHSPCPGDMLLPGTVDAEGIHSAPGIDKSTTLMSYQWKQVGPDQLEPVTLGTADIEALGRIYGTHPVDQGQSATFKPQVGTLYSIIHSDDPQAIWIGIDKAFSQTFPGSGEKRTLDVSEVQGAAVSVKEAIDLSKATNIITLVNKDSGAAYKPVEVAGNFQNAIIDSGIITGGPGEGILEAKSGGTLNANGGHKTLRGGTGSTNFTSGGGKTRVEIRPDPSQPATADTFLDYVPGQDTVVAPQSTAKVLLKPGDSPTALMPGAMPTWPGMQVSFQDSDGQQLKSLLVFSGSEKALRPQDIAIESTTGKKLPSVLEIPQVFGISPPASNWATKTNKLVRPGLPDGQDPYAPPQPPAQNPPSNRER